MTAVAGGRITVGAGANLLGIHAADRNPDATCYVGNIDVKADEDLLWELFTQVGPVSKFEICVDFNFTVFCFFFGSSVSKKSSLLCILL